MYWEQVEVTYALKHVTGSQWSVTGRSGCRKEWRLGQLSCRMVKQLMWVHILFLRKLQRLLNWKLCLHTQHFVKPALVMSILFISPGFADALVFSFQFPLPLIFPKKQKSKTKPSYVLLELLKTQIKSGALCHVCDMTLSTLRGFGFKHKDQETSHSSYRMSRTSRHTNL